MELWDIDYLADTFQEEIKQVAHPYFQPLLLRIASTRAHDLGKALVSELHKCPRGKKHWVTYQKLVGRILEYLFCPPLKTPISELGDLAAVNRRDFILPNYSSDGFWKFMRETYQADYVVADAKNYAKEVTKKEALQVANYLKPHGAGLFGLIICRGRGDKGCDHTLREQWMAYGKLILILSDDDIEAMLLAKSSGGHAEDIISQKIEEFRLSM